MRHYIFIFLIFCLSAKSQSNVDIEKRMINQTLNSWHKAAAEANFDLYFSLMTKDGVFIGTDRGIQKFFKTIFRQRKSLELFINTEKYIFFQ